MLKHLQNNQALLQKCYRFLSLRNRSEKEMRDYLDKKTQKITIIDNIIDRLKEEGLIDDKKFIAWWVEQRSYFKPKGPFVLKQELLQKGINRDLIDQYFEENKIDELALAKQVLQKKQKTLTKFKKEEKFKKAIELLLRRGFSYDLAKKAFIRFCY
jgi:regulatory protein